MLCCFTAGGIISASLMSLTTRTPALVRVAQADFLRLRRCQRLALLPALLLLPAHFSRYDGFYSGIRDLAELHELLIWLIRLLGAESGKVLAGLAKCWLVAAYPTVSLSPRSYTATRPLSPHRQHRQISTREQHTSAPFLEATSGRLFRFNHTLLSPSTQLQQCEISLYSLTTLLLTLCFPTGLVRSPPSLADDAPLALANLARRQQTTRTISPPTEEEGR